MTATARTKRIPWVEVAVVALAAAGIGWGLTRQPLQERPAEAVLPQAPPAVSSAALPAGSAPPPPAPSQAQGCGYADRGTGDYESIGVAEGRLWVRRAAVQESGSYRLLVHFHGGTAVQRLLTPDAWDFNLLLIDGGDGSASYRAMMSSTTIFDAFVASADRAVSKHVGREARADRLVLTSFSAGYGALPALLASAPHVARLDGVVLLDSLHAPFANGDDGKRGEPDPGVLKPFVAVARAAREGEMFMGVTHTAIDPGTYASTTATSRALLASLGESEEKVGWAGEGGPKRTMQLAKGRLVVRGYEGETPEAHCAQLGLLPGLLRELAR